MRVIVVDDNSIQGQTLIEYLRMHNHDGAWAPCLTGLVGLLRLSNYDIAVVDMILPCCDVKTLIGGLQEASPGLPYVVLTGLSPGHPLLELVPPGVPILHKPVEPAVLLFALETELQRHPPHRRLEAPPMELVSDPRSHEP
jgi:DNA-binding response OmpR family regulator